MPRFVSPGAMGGNALQDFLIQRELQNRQRMLDQLMQQRQAEESAMNQRSMNVREQDAALDRERFGAGQAELQRRIAQEEQDRAAEQAAQEAAGRKAQNQEGVRQMIADRLNMGPLDQGTAQQLSVMGWREGVPVPGIVDQALKPPAAPKRTVVHTTDAKGNPISKAVTEDELASGVPDYVKPEREAHGQRTPIWVVKDGKFIDLAGVAPPGSQPASTREQGRPVTSSDAGRLADFETSLNDLKTLSGTLTETANATGTGAAIGAAMPDWATDLIGWGVDAKKRQAVIDRVKQVIGKIMEGGVLRKEDEAKYAKILPTIKDTAAVAASKLAGLEQAISQRRSTFLENLGDAGYETSRFNKKPSAADLIKKYGGQ